jgi:DNA polymerase-2
MNVDERSGWLLEVYANPEGGITVWWLAADGERLKLRMDFPVTFYVAGDSAVLQQAQLLLKEKGAKLAYTRRRDLFSGEREVLAVTVATPSEAPALYRNLCARFPTLDYYDADIPLSLRFIARTGLHLLGYGRITLESDRIITIEALDSPWHLDPQPLPLRILFLAPEVNPAHRAPSRLRIQYEKADFSLELEPPRNLLISLRSIFHRYDPDLILTDYGDTWLFPQMKAWCEQCGIALNPNRDPTMDVLTRRPDSYFAYGQIIYRGAQAHLFGRWHIDRRNALLFNEYGLEGVLEQVRVTGLGVQEMARKSPGAGITAMQMLTALRNGVLVPVVKQQAEGPKSLAAFIRADRGGMVYQPIPGVYQDVAQIDFASMYPSIMVNYNISPETVSTSHLASLRHARRTNEPEGLVAQTLRPLLDKRLAIKRRLMELDPRDCRVKTLKARAAALKWLLVVCFGYLGYKNARFGKIESHEAVTALSRELLLQAKEIAEDMGFTVLHMYVDSLFVQKNGLRQVQDFSPLLEAIAARTGLSIALEGVYRWVVFLPSRRDARLPVPNRYFGVFQSGEVKYRGLEARRRDTPPWIARTQQAILAHLAQAQTLEQAAHYLAGALSIAERAKRDLKAGRVPPQDLIVTMKLSRNIEEYKSPSLAARAAKQLQKAGKRIAPGQFIRLIYTRDAAGVRAWDAAEDFDVRWIDTQRYCVLLDRAVETVLGWLSSEKTSSRRDLFALPLIKNALVPRLSGA